MPIVVIGLSHRTAPVALRERFAFAEVRIPAALQLLRDSGVVDEAVILSTCNRVEIYAATAIEPREAFPALQQFLVTCHDYRDPLTDEIYRLTEPQSVIHLFKVACGLDSMVLGETEILGQLKHAYDLALKHNHTGGRLNKAFQRAFNVAKQVRTETNIQRGSVSVASVAVELAEKIFSELANRAVLVIGAGDTSEKTCRALLGRGARSVIVANRTHDRAVALAAELGGRAVRFEDWAGEFEKIDIVISSTAAPQPILDRAKLEPLMKLRKNRPLLLIDIAVPRDIAPEVNFMENVYLYNIDDLQAIADDCLRQRQEEIVRCEAIIYDKAAALLGARPALPPPATPRPDSKPAPATLRSGGRTSRRQTDAIKVKTAGRWRGATVMALDWIAQCLRMGCRHPVANCLKARRFLQLPGLTPFTIRLVRQVPSLPLGVVVQQCRAVRHVID